MLLRSVLYIPASNARALDKARTLPVDALIIDLEDSVAPADKEAARHNAAQALETPYAHKTVLLRINGVDTPYYHADLALAGKVAVAGVLLPKVETPTQLEHLPHAPWAMIETPRGVLHAHSIAEVAQGLVLGTNDLARELGLRSQNVRPALHTALQHTLLCGKAWQRPVIDGVYNAYQDAEGFATECAQAVAWGFDGKTLIHPSQVAPCHAAFTPSQDEADDARALVAAFDAAQNGVAVYNGRMIEHLHVQQAQRTLALFASAQHAAQL